MVGFFSLTAQHINTTVGFSKGTLKKAKNKNPAKSAFHVFGSIISHKAARINTALHSVTIACKV